MVSPLLVLVLFLDGGYRMWVGLKAKADEMEELS